MSKLYKVRLLAHAGPQRRRAGFYFEKGQAQTLELSKDQLEELQNDSFFQVKEAGEAEGSSEEETTTAPDLMNKKRKQLDKMAVSLGLDPKEYNNKETLVPAIEKAQADAEAKAKAEEEAAAGGGSDDDENEDVVLTDLSVDDLKVIATELNINTADLNAETEDQTKANLIEAIEAEKAKEE